MSVWAKPIEAAKIAVVPPTTATTSVASWVSIEKNKACSPSVMTAHWWEIRKRTLQRATR